MKLIVTGADNKLLKLKKLALGFGCSVDVKGVFVEGFVKPKIKTTKALPELEEEVAEETESLEEVTEVSESTESLEEPAPKAKKRGKKKS